MVCDYFGYDDVLQTTVGWLAAGKPFSKGKTSQNVYEKLCRLNEKPRLYYVACGIHECELCEPTELKAFGSLNLTIPHSGKLYHYPEMITHYIKNHSYLPPQEFCEAVLACPPMDSNDYYDKMIANGGRSLLPYFHELWTESK